MAKSNEKLNALELLKQDHAKVKQSFKEFEKMDHQDEATMQEMVRAVCAELKAHTTIEEEIFYPDIKQPTRRPREIVLEAFEEHHVVKLVLDDLPNVDPEDERFEAKMTVLSELVEHHVEEEEKEMFKQARAVLDKAALVELGERMQAMRKM